MRILGIEFSTQGKNLVASLSQSGGLVMVPSGPGLAMDLIRIPAYRRALLAADFVIPDSGLMVLTWNLLQAGRPARQLRRYSGLALLRDLIDSGELKEPGASFWVMPSRDASESNAAWLQKHGVAVSAEEDCYVAPNYRRDLGADGRVEDAHLLEKVCFRKPRYIFINVGSGVQEQLGLYLQENLTFRPAIIPTGAAIAFLTGEQASIPPWADRFFLGWLLRTLRNPLVFGRRYASALRLLPLMLRHRDQLPPASQECPT